MFTPYAGRVVQRDAHDVAAEAISMQYACRPTGWRPLASASASSTSQARISCVAI